MTHVVFAASFVVEPIKSTLIFWSQKFLKPFTFSFAPYNQLYQQLLEPNSELSKNRDGFGVVLLRSSDFNSTVDGRESFTEAIKIFKVRNPSKLIICICPENNPTVQSSLFEKELISSLKDIKEIVLIESSEIINKYPLVDFFDPVSEKTAHIPYSPKYYSALGTLIARSIYSPNPYKVILLDCDNTLWQGECGEVGMDVAITPAYKGMQEFMLKQRESGTLLCLLSKNDEEVVERIFKHHPKMVLQWKHITAHRINWQPKSENLKSIGEELNLGLDSFIFIDDSPLEWAEVRSCHPKVRAFLLPKSEPKILPFLKNMWLFDNRRETKEDKIRSELYLQEKKRKKYRGKGGTFAEFYSKLELEISIHPFSSEEIERVSQLTFRTNQFNVTNKRRTASEIERISLSGSEIFTVTVNDKFGGYGIVGVIIVEKFGGHLLVDTFLLSCRALGKGVEHKMAAFLGELALSRRLQEVRFNCNLSKKNKPAFAFLHSLNGEVDGESFVITARKAARVRFDSTTTGSFEPLVPGFKDIPSQESEEGNDIEFQLMQTTTALHTLDLLHHTIRNEQKRERLSLPLTFNPPSSLLDAQLVEIWESVLKIAPIGIDEDFFALGGDSLKAIEVLSLIAKELLIQLNPEDLFLAPTIKDLTCFIQNRQQENLPRIERKKDGEDAPLSYIQERLWLFDSIVSEKSVYNIPSAFRIFGKLNRNAFNEAFQEVITKHSVLRTTFSISADANLKLQVVHPGAISLKASEITLKEHEIQNLMWEEAWQPFQMHDSPMIRATLYQINAEDHLFIVTLHHSIADDVSLSIFFHELSQLYQTARINKKPKERMSPSLQYRDFSIWQREKSQIKLFNRQKEYWAKQLERASPCLLLPSIFPKPKKPSFKAGRQTGSISPEVMEALKKISLDHGTTLFVTLLATFLSFLHRYTTQEDILLATPISNRHLAGVSEMIGPLVNILPIRAQFERDQSFSWLLGAVRKTVLEAIKNQDLPFEQILNLLGIERKISPHPLVQAAFVMRENKEPFVLEDLKIEPYEISPKYLPFDLIIIAETAGKECILHLDYSLDLFEAEQMKGMWNHLELFLNEISKNPDIHIGSIPYLSEKEIHHQTILWNNTKASRSKDERAEAVFDRMAMKNPEALSVIACGTQLTYRELVIKSDLIAAALNHLGARRNEIVAICVSNKADLARAIMGVLKSGAAFLLLDPEHPKGHLEFLVKDSKAEILLSDQSLKETFSFFKGKTMDVDSQMALYPVLPITYKSTEDLAYLNYTSGTTGNSKGVMITHRSLCNLAKALSKSFQMGPNSRVLQFSSPAFDTVIAEILVTLLTGGTLVIPDPDDRYRPQKLSEFIKDQRITTAILPPSFISETLDCIDYTSLQTLVCAGEINREEIVKHLAGKINLINGYGPTEATVCSATYQYIDQDPHPAATIGRPIDNTALYILDPYLNLLPIGAVGEIHIGGKGLSIGYHCRTGLNSTKFITSPFSEDPAVKLYKTGDLARFLPSGDIEYVGRQDNQVKLNGHRIELEQIEAKLLMCEGVIQAATLLMENDSGKKYLSAYLVLNRKLELDEIRRLMQRLVPSSMVPSLYHIIEKMPLLSNGKTDRARLRELPVEMDQTRILTPARNKLETGLVNIWEEIFEQPVGIFDNFFSLGGTSLQLVQMGAKIQHTFDKPLPISEIFECPTIEGIAKLLEKSLVQINSSIFKIQENGIKPPLFLAPPLLGVSFPYLSLKSYIPDRPIFGINHVNNLKSIEVLAADYIQALKSIKPKGPYNLGGWSFGGVVAFEMAHQLTKIGESVERVILIDSQFNPPHKDLPQEARGEMENGMQLLKEYRINPYAGRVIFLKASDSPTETLDALIRAVTSPLEIYPLPGKHAKLFAFPEIEYLADTLIKVLEN